jgi:hypothetical protein
MNPQKLVNNQEFPRTVLVFDLGYEHNIRGLVVNLSYNHTQ